MNVKTNKNVVIRQFTIENKGNNSISIKSDCEILSPSDRIFFKGDILKVNYGIRIKKLTLLEKIKFLFGYVDVSLEYQL